MYVCVCKSVTHAEIVERVRGGVGCFDELQFETGVGGGCGRCEDTARALVADTLHATTVTRPAAQTDRPVAASPAERGRCACAGMPAAQCSGAAAAGGVPAVGAAAGVTVSRRLPISARSM